MTTQPSGSAAGRSGPSLDTLMMLGSIAPKSQEEGKPTVDVALTAVEIQALAVLSNARFRSLFDAAGEDAQRMCAIYLGITSKLMLATLAASVGQPSGSDVRPEATNDR